MSSILAGLLTLCRRTSEGDSGAPFRGNGNIERNGYRPRSVARHLLHSSGRPRSGLTTSLNRPPGVPRVPASTSSSITQHRSEAELRSDVRHHSVAAVSRLNHSRTSLPPECPRSSGYTAWSAYALHPFLHTTHGLRGFRGGSDT